jgi:hypothetical protein
MCSFCVVIINCVACKDAFVDDEQKKQGRRNEKHV